MRLDHPEEVARTTRSLMDGFAAPWGVAGGWAVDLYLGRTTRVHDDVELAVFRQDQLILRSQLGDWTFTVSVNGGRRPWEPGEVLELPAHEIHAYPPDDPSLSMEFLLNERDSVNWVFRRDPTIVLPLEEAILDTGFGVPVLSPTIVLLFKAKAPTAKDEVDLRAVRPELSGSSSRWLRSALEACHPDHPWIGVLESAGGG